MRRAGCLLLALLLGGCAANALEAPASREAEAKSYPFRVLHLRGAPYEIGLQQGRLLQPQIRRLLQEVLHGQLLRHPLLSPERLDQAAARFRPFIPARHIREMEGIAEGAGVPFREVLIANAFYDIREVIRADPLGLACSSLAGTDEGGRVVVGRNLDFTSFRGELPRSAVVVVVEAEGYAPFAKVGFAGQAGVWTGMSARGLFVAMHTSRSADVSPDGTPVNFLLRRALEEAGGPEEAASLLRGARRVSGGNVLLAGKDPGASQVAEFSARWFEVRRASRGAIAVTNHFVTREEPRQKLYYNSLGRFLTLQTALAERGGRLSPEAAQGVLLGEAILQDHLGGRFATLHSVVARPSTGELWVAHGVLPVSRAGFVRLSLAEELKGRPGLRERWIPLQPAGPSAPSPGR